MPNAILNEIPDGRSVQALYQNTILKAAAGFNVVSGCSVSPGSSDLTLDITSGTVIYDGSRETPASDTITLTGADPSDPRRDVVAYDPTANGFEIIDGTAESTPADQGAGVSRFEYYTPSPPSLAGMDKVPLAEIWVPAGASDITAADINDIRADGQNLRKLFDGRPYIFGTDGDYEVQWNDGESVLEVRNTNTGETFTFGDDTFTVPGHKATDSEAHGLITVSSDTTTGDSPYYRADTDAAGSSITITLASADAVEGREINVKREGSSEVVIDTEGSETIQGSSTITLTQDQQSVTLLYDPDSTDWDVW